MNRAYCWGDNSDGQVAGFKLAVATPNQVSAPMNANPFTAVFAGFNESCALQVGTLFCWGRDDVYQFGDGAGAKSHPFATQIGTATDWSAVALADYSGCGLRGGALSCWGQGISGDGTTMVRQSPVPIGTTTDWTEVAVGPESKCGLRGGALYCWGTSNGLGPLGDGATVDRLTPVQIGTHTDWSTVQMGGLPGSRSACGIRQGALYCWGANDNGQQAMPPGPTQAPVPAPTQIGTQTDWSYIAVGHRHMCGIRSGGLYCWGAAGALGDTTNMPHYTPTQVGTDTDWSAVVAGDAHSCGLRGGAVYCWGQNGRGQLGTGGGSSATPVAVTLP